MKTCDADCTVNTEGGSMHSVACQRRLADPAPRAPTLSYDWRKQSIATARGGFYAEVEKFWCTPGDDADEGSEEDGWRWSGFAINELGKPTPGGRTLVSSPMSFSAAQAEAENWIQAQIDRVATASNASAPKAPPASPEET